MALNALTLSVTQGVQGYPFGAIINGLTTGRVEVIPDGSPGFSTVNGKVFSQALPYAVSTVVLREYEPGVGQGFRDSRIDITAATRETLAASAAGQIGAGRVLKGWRLAGTRAASGETSYAVLAEDDLGATLTAAVGSAVPTITGTPPAFTAGQAGSFQFTVTPPGTPVTITVTRDGQPDTLAAHGFTHNGTGLLTTTGAIL